MIMKMIKGGDLMTAKKKAFQQDERRRTIKYSDRIQSDEYTDEVLKCGPIHQTLIAAERYTTDRKTNAAIPSDTVVEQMRDWNIEKKV